MSSDLPALRPDDLAAALARRPGRGAGRFVADADGTGTTLLAAGPGAALRRRYGAGSRPRHRASGARGADRARPALRRDVDTPHDLRAARALGRGSAHGGGGRAAAVPRR